MLLRSGLWAMLGLAFGLLAVPVLAQNPLSEGPAEEPVVPNPGDLRPGWWSYLGDAGEELEARAQALADSIDTVVLSLNVADSPKAVSLADRAKQEIAGYVQARQFKVPEDPLTLRTTGPFTLEEFLAAVRHARELELSRQRESVELAELADLQDLERRKLDEQFTRYLSVADPAQRIVAGLAVIGDRALLAVTRLQVERKESQLAAMEARIQAFRSQAELAGADLTTEGFDLDAAIEEVKALQERLDEARANTEGAKSALLDLDPTAEYAATRASYVRQRLLAANLAENQAALRLGVVRASIAWYRLRQPDGESSVDQAHALIEGDLRPLLARVRDNLSSWQRSAEQLSLALDTTEIRDREIRLMRDRSRELGQENLQGLQSLILIRSELTALTEVLASATASLEGGVSGVWRRMSLTVGQLGGRFSALADTALFHLGDVPVTPSALVQMLVILGMAWTLSLLLRRGLDRLDQRRHFSDRSSLYLLGRVAHYVLITAALFLALAQLGFDFTSVALVAGALSVGIGFGLQNIVNNFVSGLILMFDRSLKIGDYIELDSGLTGVVREIKVRSTRINTNDNVDVLVPNSEFFNSRLVNWTHTDAMGRFRIPFGVAYGSDKEKVREAALQAAEDVEYTLHNMAGKEPEVWMSGFGDSSLDFVLLVWVSRQGVRRPSRVRSAYLWALDNRLREYGIEIPFPQRDLHLRSGFEATGPMPAED